MTSTFAKIRILTILAALWLAASFASALTIRFADGDEEQSRIAKRENGMVTLRTESNDIGLGAFSLRHKESEIVADEDDWLRQAREAAEAGDRETARRHYQDILVWNPGNAGAQEGLRALSAPPERGNATPPRTSDEKPFPGESIHTVYFDISQHWAVKQTWDDPAPQPLHFTYEPFREDLERIMKEYAGIEPVRDKKKADMVVTITATGELVRREYKRGSVRYNLEASGRLSVEKRARGVEFLTTLTQHSYHVKYLQPAVIIYPIPASHETAPGKTVHDPESGPFREVLLEDKKGPGGLFVRDLATIAGPAPLARLAAGNNPREQKIARVALDWLQYHNDGMDTPAAFGQLREALLVSRDAEVDKAILDIWRSQRTPRAAEAIRAYLCGAPNDAKRAIHTLRLIWVDEGRDLLLEIAMGSIASPEKDEPAKPAPNEWRIQAMKELAGLPKPEHRPVLQMLSQSPDPEIAAAAQAAAAKLESKIANEERAEYNRQQQREARERETQRREAEKQRRKQQRN